MMATTSPLRQMAEDCIALVSDMPRASRAVEPNARIHELVFKDGPLTPEEWAELEAYERTAQ